MESFDEEKRENYLFTVGESDESSGSALQAKLAELVKTKEELERAKESTMQSWIDSRPLIDELERLKEGLAGSQNRSSMSDIVIPELESEFESTINSIRGKKEEEFKASKIINEISRALDQTRQELEILKLETDEERRIRSKLKQVLWLKRQTLGTSQLTLRAVIIECEAFGASEAEAQGHIENSEMEENNVELSQEEYYALTRRAKEETQLADWRITVSMEQKLAAEASRNLALITLKESYSGNRSRRRRIKEEQKRGYGEMKEEAEEEQDSSFVIEAPINNKGLAFPKARANTIAHSVPRNPQRKIRRSQSNPNQKMIRKKKASILDQIRSFFKKLFG